VGNFYAFVGEGIMFPGRPSATFIRSFVLAGQVLLPWYLMNA